MKTETPGITKKFDSLIKCVFNIDYGLTYQSCRFCGNGWPPLDHLWKYAVRHYICDDCLRGHLESRHMSDWSPKEEQVYSIITGQIADQQEEISK